MNKEIVPGWWAEVDRGPECLFVRLHGDAFHDDASHDDANDPGNAPTPQPSRDQSTPLSLAGALWNILQRCTVKRVVLEMDLVPRMESMVVGELMQLRRRITEEGGMLRICGLSPENRQLLHNCHLDSYLPQYDSREQAVMGRRETARS